MCLDDYAKLNQMEIPNLVCPAPDKLIKFVEIV